MRKAALAFLPLEMRSVIGFEESLESRVNDMDRLRRVNELKARLWGKSVRDGHTQFAGETVERFLKAQEGVWEIVLPELRAGEKRGHWMWYVFPQIVGLGQSSMAMRYAIRDLEEAREYLAHPVLGARLRDAMATVLAHCGKKTSEDIFMELDAMKLKSCATLFDLVEPGGIFAEVLGAFYGGLRCERTLELVCLQGLRGDYQGQ